MKDLKKLTALELAQLAKRQEKLALDSFAEGCVAFREMKARGMNVCRYGSAKQIDIMLEVADGKMPLNLDTLGKYWQAYLPNVG